jgi:Fe2+ or Zn2+ uptake regulation protein
MLNNYQLIENFIVQIDRPFCIKEISDITAIPETTVWKYVHKFLEQRRIVLINGVNSPKYYRYVRKTESVCKKNSLKFSPDKNKLKIIYETIGTHPRIEDVVKSVPFSKTTVWRYVKVLLNDDCVKRFKGKYYQKEFKPSCKTFDMYPKIKKHTRKPELIKELHNICNKYGFECPDVKNFKNSNIEKLIRNYRIKSTINIIIKGEKAL